MADPMFIRVTVAYPEGRGSPPSSSSWLSADELVGFIDVLTDLEVWLHTPPQWRARWVRCELFAPAEWDELTEDRSSSSIGLQVETLPFDQEPF
jgi:hypothetical protein